jgi:lipopolysaccharide assembly outer membrane protein LptD (OstA)
LNNEIRGYLMMRRLLMVIFLCLIMISGPVMHIMALEGPIVETEAREEEKTIHIRAGYLRYTEDYIEITGGVTIIKGDNEITAPQGVYYREEKKVELTEGVNLTHDQGEIKACRLTALLDQDEYIFSGEVVLLQLLEENDFQLETPFLKLLTGDNSFSVEKGAVIYYDQRRLEADLVTYNDQEQTLKLVNNVRIEEENGDWIKSQQAIFYLDSGEFIADGEVELELDISSN